MSNQQMQIFQFRNGFAYLFYKNKSFLKKSNMWVFAFNHFCFNFRLKSLRNHISAKIKAMIIWNSIHIQFFIC